MNINFKRIAITALAANTAGRIIKGIHWQKPALGLTPTIQNNIAHQFEPVEMATHFKKQYLECLEKDGYFRPISGTDSLANMLHSGLEITNKAQAPLVCIPNVLYRDITETVYGKRLGAIGQNMQRQLFHIMLTLKSLSILHQFKTHTLPAIAGIISQRTLGRRANAGANALNQLPV